jgi:hypothetical protein
MRLLWWSIKTQSFVKINGSSSCIFWQNIDTVSRWHMRAATLIKGMPDLTLLLLYIVLNVEDIRLVYCQYEERQFVVGLEVIGPIIIIFSSTCRRGFPLYLIYNFSWCIQFSRHHYLLSCSLIRVNNSYTSGHGISLDFGWKRDCVGFLTQCISSCSSAHCCVSSLIHT